MSFLRTNYSINYTLRQNIEKIKSSFPIKNYIDKSLYYEMYTVIKYLHKTIPDFVDKRLLDIGSGPLDKTAILNSFGFHCYAVDDLNDPWHKRSDNQNKIKLFAKEQGINFFHQVEDDYSVPFEPNTFDVVTTFAVIEHLHESPRILFNTAGKFLKTNGILVITMPNSVNLRKRLSVLIGATNYPPVDQFFYSPGNWRGHVREYTLSETIYICERAGFEVIEARCFEHLVFNKLNFLLRILYSLITFLIPHSKSGLLVICRKPANYTLIKEDMEQYRSVIKASVPKGVA